MNKKVNIYPSGPITTINPPIRLAVKNVTKSDKDIRACIIARAIVEEILPDGTVINLDLNNYNKDNFVKAVDKEPLKVEYKIPDDIKVEEPKKEAQEQPKQQQNNNKYQKYNKHQKYQQSNNKEEKAVENKPEVTTPVETTPTEETVVDAE